MQTITTDEAATRIRGSAGKVFTVTFVKKDNTIRVMNARLGVKKHLKGGTLKYDPASKGLIGCFDMANGAYKMISIKTMIKLKIEKGEFEIS